MEQKLKGIVGQYAMITLSCALYAVGFNWCFDPNHLSVGGFTGVAQIINFFIPQAPIGPIIVVLNLPLFILSWKKVGRQWLYATLYATLVSSGMIDLLAGVYTFRPMEPMLAAIYGGVIVGLGCGLMLRYSATTGGTELAANLLTLHIHGFSLGKFIMAIDLIIVLVSAVVYHDYESPLYAILVIYITSKVIDAVIYGSDSGTGKMMFIISPKNNEIAQRIMDDLERGVTELKSRGAYSGREGTVLMCAVGRQEVHKTYDIIHELDPDAFIVVDDVGEITGLGFRDFHQYRQKGKKDKNKDKK